MAGKKQKYLENDYTLLKNNQFVEDVKNYLEYLENKEEKEVIK